MYCGTDAGGVATHTRYTNNVISREFFPQGGYYGPTNWCNRVDVVYGNVWDGNYVPPPGGSGAAPAPASAQRAGRRGRRPALSFAATRRVALRALRREFPRRGRHRAGRVRFKCHRVTGRRVRCGVR